MTSFCESYNLINLIKQPTSPKNPEKPISLSKEYETGLSGFHRVTFSVIKTHFRKLPLRIIGYSDFSNYQKANFIKSLNEGLLEEEYMESLFKDPYCF